MAYKYEHTEGINECMAIRKIKYPSRLGLCETEVVGYGKTCGDAQLDCFLRIMRKYPSAQRIGECKYLVPFGYFE